MFTNKQINEIYETRYIASWLKAGGNLYYGEDIDEFSEWLKSLGLSDDEVYHLVNMATCGKLELEVNAKSFIKSIKKH